MTDEGPDLPEDFERVEGAIEQLFNKYDIEDVDELEDMEPEELRECAEEIDGDDCSES